MSNQILTDPQDLRALLGATGKHDATAFRSLYQATAPKLFGFVLRILRKRELAEEAMQEAFVAIWHSASNYQAHLAAPMTWMTAIVRNKALDILRRSEHQLEIDAAQLDSELVDALHDPGATPIDALQMSSEAKALAHCMARLEALHRQAISLAFYHELSHGEVAQRMALPLGTVKAWIRRGLERLRHCLSEREQA